MSRPDGAKSRANGAVGWTPSKVWASPPGRTSQRFRIDRFGFNGDREPGVRHGWLTELRAIPLVTNL